MLGTCNNTEMAADATETTSTRRDTTRTRNSPVEPKKWPSVRGSAKSGTEEPQTLGNAADLGTQSVRIAVGIPQNRQRSPNSPIGAEVRRMTLRMRRRYGRTCTALNTLRNARKNVKTRQIRSRSQNSPLAKRRSIPDNPDTSATTTNEAETTVKTLTLIQAVQLTTELAYA